TEPNSLARENVQPVGGEPIVGHGLDALGRAWYVYRNTQLGSDGLGLVTGSDGAVSQRLELAEVPSGGEIADVVFDPQLQLLGYRVQSGSESWINYVDLSGDRPASIRVNQNFQHSDAEPEDHARFGWSADGSRIAVVGVQSGQTL